MALPTLTGEFGVVADPDLSFSTNGNARLKLRVIAKDRKRDSTGNWVDGDPWFGDIVVWGKTAEYLCESIAKGDSIVVANAKAEQHKFTDKEGNERTAYSYVADAIGVSTRWGTARTQRVIDSNNAVADVAEMLGGTEVSPF